MKRTNRVLVRILLNSLTLTIVSICASSQDSPLLLNNPRPTDTRLYSLYLKANFQQMSGDFDRALKTYNDLFELNAPPYVYEGYLRLLSETNQFPAIAALIDKTEDVFPESLDIQLIYVQSLLSTNQDERAEELLLKLKEKYPNNEQVTYFSAAFYEKSSQFPKALDMLDSFLKKRRLKPKFFLFFFLKAKIYLKMESFPDALLAINNSLKLHPKFEKGWLFKGLLLEQMGNITAAIKSYKQFVTIAGPDIAVIKQIVQLLFNEEEFVQAAQTLKQIKSDHPKYFFDLALLHWKAQMNQPALEYVTQSLERDPNFIKAKVLKLEVLLALNKKQELLSMIEQWLSAEKEDNSVVSLVALFRKIGIPAPILSQVLKQVHQKKPKNYTLLVAAGDLLMQTNDLDSALDCYRKALPLVDRIPLKSKIYFQIGTIQFATGKDTAAEKSLLHALKFKPTYPSAYNLLAYYYARNNRNLKKAHKFVDEALKIRPQSAYYLDTKGYVLFQLGKKDEAIELFKKAYKLAPEDMTIKEHLQKARDNQL